jgi:glutathione peroxidase
MVFSKTLEAAGPDAPVASPRRKLWWLRFMALASFVFLVLAPQVWASPTATSPKTSSQAVKSCPALLNHTFPRLQDDLPQNLCQYSGKVILIVNTASFCGFTQQYEGLEKLYASFKDQGLVVLGFPSNDFGNQEPGSSKEIADFCSNTFGVKFPMVAKTSVKGPKANRLFKQLAQQSEAPGWNFHKYLIDREGRLARSFSSQVPPSDRRLVSEIERVLSAQRS